MNKFDLQSKNFQTGRQAILIKYKTLKGSEGKYCHTKMIKFTK